MSFFRHLRAMGEETFARHQVTITIRSPFGCKEQKTQPSGLNKWGLFFSHGKMFSEGLLLALPGMPNNARLFFTQSS